MYMPSVHFPYCDGLYGTNHLTKVVPLVDSNDSLCKYAKYPPVFVRPTTYSVLVM